MLLVVLMVLMGQAGYFQSGYWMNDGESTPVEPLATTTDGPMATFSTDVFPSLDADIRSGDLSDWTFWEDENGFEGFGPWDTGVKYNQNGNWFNSQHMQSNHDVDTAGSLTFTNRLETGQATFATSTANLSLDLPFAAQLTFGYVTQNQNWNASELHIDVLQSGSVVTSTSIDHSGVYYTNIREGTASLLVPAGVSTVSLSLDVSIASGPYSAGGFWLLHEFSVTAPNASTVMSLGSDHACVLTSDGDAKCWGANNVGQLGQGHIENMGDEAEEMGQDLPYVNFPTSTFATAVSAGGRHTCYLLTTTTSDGMPLCVGQVNLLGYGWDDDGAIGDAYLEDASVMPDWPLPAGRHATHIEAGWNHTCAVFDDGSVGCWGDNAHGQLGTGNTTFLGDAADEVGDGLALVDLPAGTTVRSLALGWDHSCVLYGTGDVACWGDNTYGQLGLGHSTTIGDGAGEMGSNLVNISLPTGLNVTSLTAGDGFTCAVFSDESIRCWGRNDVGQLGQGNTADFGDDNGESVSALSAIDLGSTYASGTKTLDAGRNHVCSVVETSSTAGIVKCWGGNGDGQLGIATAGSDQHRGDGSGEMGSSLPALGMGLDVGGLMAFEVGDRFACLMRLSDVSDTDPQVQCWGVSDQGRLGYGNTETLGDSSSDMIPTDDVQLKLNDPYTYSDCLGAGMQAQIEVDTADAARHVKVLADDDACPVIVYTDDDASSVLMAVYHNNRWVEETVFETSDEVVDLDAGIGPDGRVHVAWVQTSSTSTNDVYHASKSMGQWSSNSVFFGLDQVGMLLYPDGGIELVMIADTSNYIRSSLSTDGGESWGLEISRDYGSTAAWSDLNVAIDGDGVAYASYNVDGTLRVISRPAGGDGVGADDWTAHVDVRSDLSDDGDVERQSLVSSVGSLGGMLSVSLTNASALAYANNKVATGNAQSCGILANGSLMCWGGGDQWGAQGNGLASNSNLQSPSWVDLGAGLTAESVAFGQHYGCAVLSDGSLKCWGKNDDGQIGDGTSADKHSPVAVSLGAGRTADAVAMGNAHTCALLDNGSVQCWGDDTWGDLGNGAGVTDRLSPSEYVDFGAGRTAVALDVGTDHSCAVLDNGSLMCWGRDHKGQLGNGGTTTADQHSPVFVDLGTGRTAIAVSTGHIHTCAILDNGSLKCWGSDDDGRLGNGAVTGDQPSPVLVDLGTGRTAVAVVAAMYNTCAILDDGSVKCWGGDSYGQLGNGASITANQPSPVSVNLGTGFGAVAINMFSLHTCAILADTSMKCWGVDATGTLGNGAGTTTQHGPTIVVGSHTWDVTTTASSASADTAGDATVSACLDGWSSCTTASDWTVDASLSGINSTTMDMVTDLDQVHHLVHNTSTGTVLRSVGPAGTLSQANTIWPHGIEEVSLALTSQGTLFAAVRNASDGHLWLVREEAVGGLGLSVDLDGDGWLGLDEMACGTDPNDATSTPTDADGDGICDADDDVDDDVHPRGTRTVALGDGFGCAITGDVHLSLTQPAVVCWGENGDDQLGSSVASALSSSSQTFGYGVDLPNWSVAVDLDAGERHACTVTTDGDVYCWGANDHGQLGRNTSYASALPGLVALQDDVRALGVATGNNHTCIHDQRGDVWCWGSNLEGGLGKHVAANPGGVVHVDTELTPWLVSSWRGSVSANNRFSVFEHGIDKVSLSRISCCNHVNVYNSEVDFTLPMDATLVLNLTALNAQLGLELTLGGQTLAAVSQTSNEQINISIDLERGTHTLQAEWSTRTNSYPTVLNRLSLRAAVHGIDVVEGAAYSVANSTMPVMQLTDVNPTSDLNAGPNRTCATDVEGSTTCWTGYTPSTNLPRSPTTEWQGLIDNASTASGCGFTYTSNSVPDPLDGTPVLPIGASTSNGHVTMANHTTLPVDCSGLRVGKATVSGVTYSNWEDLHLVPVEVGRSYLIEALTTDRHNAGSSNVIYGQTKISVYDSSSGSVKDRIGSSATGSGPENQLVHSVSWNDPSMLVIGVKTNQNGHGLLEYTLKVTEVGDMLPTAVARSAVTSELTSITTTPPATTTTSSSSSNSDALLGTADVGPKQTCSIPLDGVGLACESQSQDHSTWNLVYEDVQNRTRSLSIGATSACAILNGTLSCWGNETTGVLGNGGSLTSSSATPVAVSLPSGWVPVAVEVSDYDQRACAVLRNAADTHRVYCWGSDTYGGLGNGGGLGPDLGAPSTSVNLYSSALELDAPTFELDRQPWDVAELVASGTTGMPCVRSHEGLVKCWNDDPAYLDWELLDAPNEMGANMPFVDLGTEVYATDLTQIHINFNYPTTTCALLENGTVTCWGWAIWAGVSANINGYGQNQNHIRADGDARHVVGSGTPSGVLTDVVGIAQSCALLADGSVRCWSPSNGRSHFEVDLAGARIVSLHEGFANGAAQVCAIHASLVRATCFDVTSSGGTINHIVLTDADGLHDVLSDVGVEYTLRGPLELTEDGAVLDLPVLKPGSLALDHGGVLCGIGPESSPECVDGSRGSSVFGGRIVQMDGPCVLRLDAEVLCLGGEPGLLGAAGELTDGSSITVEVALNYGTVNLDLRNHDTDGDGVKDLWDDDDDDDGVLDHEDAFPRDECASIDTDRDGHPDALVNGCTTFLIEDADDDNDGWSDLDEVSCGTHPLLNTRLPGDLDGDGTCDALDADMDGDGWDDADERMCSPQGVVLRDLPPADIDVNRGAVFLGGPRMDTPMFAAEAEGFGTYVFDLTEDDPMATGQRYAGWSSNDKGMRVADFGAFAAVTDYEWAGSNNKFTRTTLLHYDGSVPDVDTHRSAPLNPGQIMAPFMTSTGEVNWRGSNFLQDGNAHQRSVTNTGDYPVQVLRLPNGDLLLLESNDHPATQGFGTLKSIFDVQVSLQRWNETFDDFDIDATPYTLPTSLTSRTSYSNAPGKMVMDGQGNVHWVVPTASNSLIVYEHVVINETSPFVHNVGSVTGGYAHSYPTPNSFGLDWTPAGGVRLSYMLSNRSIGLAELNASASPVVSVLPGGPLSWTSISTIGHATDDAGLSTVVVTTANSDSQPVKVFQPVLRTDPAADPTWTPADANGDGTCDASQGAMLHFNEDDLTFEVDRASNAEPIPFGGYAVTGVTALSGLPNGLVLNPTTGAISGTPTVPMPEGVNVTLRIASNGATVDLVVTLRVFEAALVNAPDKGPLYSNSIQKASHVITSSDGRLYTLTTQQSGTDSFGRSIHSSDLVLTAYRPGGSNVVNWTSAISTYGSTRPLDLALDANGDPLVLFNAPSGSSAPAHVVEFANSEQNIAFADSCTTLYSTETVCDDWFYAPKLVLAAFGQEGLVRWTQHHEHPAGNGTSTKFSDNSGNRLAWGRYWAHGNANPMTNTMTMVDEHISVSDDGSIALAIQFCSTLNYIGTFGGHAIITDTTSGYCDSSTSAHMPSMMLSKLTSDGEVEWVKLSNAWSSSSNDKPDFQRLDLDRTSNGSMLLSYVSVQSHGWDDLPLPDADPSFSLSQSSLTLDRYGDHYMVMFDTNGSAMWYQHDGLNQEYVRYNQMVLDDDSIVVVRSTPEGAATGVYLDAGVTNTTAGLPSGSDVDGALTYNASTMPAHPLHMFHFRASDGARLGVDALQGADLQNGLDSTVDLGEGTHYMDVRGIDDGQRVYVYSNTRASSSENRLDFFVVEGNGTVVSSAAAMFDDPGNDWSDMRYSSYIRLDAAGLPMILLDKYYGTSNNDPQPITWQYVDGRQVDGIVASVLRFSSGMGHTAEHDPKPLGTNYIRYPDLATKTPSSASDLGETWSLVGLNGSTWLPNGLTFNSATGAIGFATTSATFTPVPYWLNMSVDGRTFSHQIMLGRMHLQVGFDLPDTFTATRGAPTAVHATALTGSGLQPARVSPDLPSGLSLLSNGSIVGTPSGNLTATTYVVEVCNDWNDCEREVIVLEILEPLPDITYGGNNSLWFPRDSIVNEDPVNLGGAVETWSMSGTLPMGLSFDNLSGRITGTAILIQNTTSVNITATNNAGSFTVQVNVTVPGAGIALVFPASNLSLVNGTTMQNFGGQTTGETPASWAITPSLPLGLHLGSTNGTIYGTPTVFAAAANHTVTVTSISGATASYVLNIEVLEPVEQITLTLPLTSLDLTNNSAMQPFTGQTSGDAAVLWNVTPDLPTGLNFGTSNGTLWGTPTNVSGPVVYTITAYTASGANDSATLTITISADFDNDGIPDHVDPDDDNDGVLDGAEEAGCSLDPDCDDDGYGDGVDAFPVDPTEWVDTDNDGIGNNADDDDDGDGWTETEETECGNHSDLDAMDRPGDLDNDGLCDALDDVDDRPIYLVLTETELLLPVNATMAPFEVLQFGADVRSWNVTPDLPLGLTIDSEGRISGIPTVVSNLAVYTINASNDLNWATVNLSIAVLDEDADFDNDGLPDAVDPDDDNDGWSDVDEAQCGPTDPFDAEDMPDDSDNDGICDLLDDVSDLQITVTHEPRELHLTVNVTMTPVEANVTGGDVITWTAMGELPAGLSLDAQNGTISGTPTEVVADVLVQIEANNSKHSTTTWVLITVHEDTDADGIANIMDDDDDNDGWLDSEEAVCATDPLDANGVPSDLDGDGTCDRADPDIDGDGWANVQEQFCSTDPRDTDDMPSDTDGDGICNLVDTDDDNDGWADTTEAVCETSPIASSEFPSDFDGDLTCDLIDPDDDNDGVIDQEDAFPFDAGEWVDRNSDGLGDNAHPLTVMDKMKLNPEISIVAIGSLAAMLSATMAFLFGRSKIRDQFDDDQGWEEEEDDYDDWEFQE